MHLSLHTSTKWHMKVGRRTVFEWDQPAELIPGYTRALVIVQPVAVAMFALPKPAGAAFLDLPVDAEPTLFEVWIERTGANLLSWPGKNASGTALVGRIPLAGGVGTCCVVSLQAPVPSVSYTPPIGPTDEQFSWFEKTSAQGSLYGTMIVGSDDGALFLLDGRFDPATSQT
jgi:hypothetical protein